MCRRARTKQFSRRNLGPAVIGLVTVLGIGCCWPGFAGGDSLNLRLAGEWPFSGLNAALGVPSRNLVFCGSGGGVYVLDVTNPAQPRKQSESIRTGGIIGALAYDSALQRLYIAGRPAGLEIWDVSEPERPLRIGACRTFLSPATVTLSGSYAYVADRDSGLRIVNVSNPANPYQVGRFDSPGSACDVAVSDGYAYLADSTALRVLNVSNPASPHEIGHCLDSANQVLAVMHRDTWAFVVDGAGLVVANVASPDSPYRAGSCPVPSRSCDLALKDRYAYVADANFGIVIMDVSVPSNPVRVGAMGGHGKRSISIADTFAYTMDISLNLLSVADPGHLYALGSYWPPTLDGSCAVSGSYAYVGSDSGLHVIDCADLADMRRVASVPFSSLFGWADIVVREPYAYVSALHTLTVVDVSADTNPVVVGQCSLARGSAMRMAITGSLVGIAAQNSVQLADVSSPARPIMIGELGPLLAWGISAQDSLLFVADFSEGGLRIYNVADPEAPREIGFCFSKSYPLDVTAQGSLAFVADGDSGLMIADVSDPRAPREIGRYRDDALVSHVAVQGTYVYVAGYRYATRQTALRILDVANPSTPVLVAFYDDANVTQNIVPVGPGVFVATRSSGLHVFEHTGYSIEETERIETLDRAREWCTTLLQADDFAFSFFIPEAERLRFYLYDLSGREVARLPCVRYARGRHLVHWNVGRLAAGVYCLRSDPHMKGATKLIICR